MKLLTAAIAMVLGASAPAVAQDMLAGDYARDAAGCAATDYALSILEGQLVFPSFSCVGTTMSQQDKQDGRRVYRAEAPHCYSAGSNAPTARAFTIVVEGARLRVAPDGGADTGWLSRCEKSERR